MNHEIDFQRAEQHDDPAMRRLLAWLDPDMKRVSTEISRVLHITPEEAYQEVHQELALTILSHRVPWENH